MSRRSKDSFHWHKRHHRDALNGMARMSLEDRGAYTTLLDMMYDRGGPVPDEERMLAGMMLISVRAWKTIRARLIETGKIEVMDTDHESSLFNERARKELENQSKVSRNSAENGALGGNKTAEKNKTSNKNNDTGAAPAASSLHPYRDTDTDRELDKNIIGTSSLLSENPQNPIPANDAQPSRALALSNVTAAKPRPVKARGTKFVPDDWQPSATHYAKAIERRVNIDVEIEKFRLHEFRDPKSDFDRAFHRWLNNAAPSNPNGSSHALNGPTGGYGRPSSHQAQSRAERDQQAALDVLAQRRSGGFQG